MRYDQELERRLCSKAGCGREKRYIEGYLDSGRWFCSAKCAEGAEEGPAEATERAHGATQLDNASNAHTDLCQCEMCRPLSCVDCKVELAPVHVQGRCPKCHDKHVRYFEGSMVVRCSSSGEISLPEPAGDMIVRDRLAFMPRDIVEKVKNETHAKLAAASRGCDSPIAIASFHETARQNQALQRWYDEQSKHRFEMPVSTAPSLSVGQLARALWETDKEVQAFVERVADHRRPMPSGLREVDAVQLGRAEDAAWDRDELGARTRWTKRAEEVLLLVGDSEGLR